MRKDFTPQVETVEISDADLDTISGGVAGARVNVAGYGAAVGIGDVLGTVEQIASIVPVSQITGLVSAQPTGI